MYSLSSTTSSTPAMQGMGQLFAISVVLLLGQFAIGGEFLPLISHSPMHKSRIVGPNSVFCAVTTCSLEQAQAGIWEPRPGKLAQVLTNDSLFLSRLTSPCRCSSFVLGAISIHMGVSAP